MLPLQESSKKLLTALLLVPLLKKQLARVVIQLHELPISVLLSWMRLVLVMELSPVLALGLLLQMLLLLLLRERPIFVP
jgi:hypothetical protein